MVHNPIAGRAAVLGSGIAGLFAARVLSDHFREVVMIDRDDVADGLGARDGVPQGKHFHALLPGGLNIGCELFPGFTDDLEAAGAVRCVGGQDFFVFRPEGKSYALAVYQPEPRPVGTIYFMSRPLLENCVRRRVEALPNVHARYGCLVTEPLATTERLAGVVYNHFSSTASLRNVDGSIYWTASTAAHEVQGAVRAKWASLGWERSCLGYPITDTAKTPTGAQGTFQRGLISLDAISGVATSSC